MKIKDVEKMTHIDRATLYYYEKEGLLSPERTENGYRIYNKEDLIMIEKIKLLRSLQVSIEDLKTLKREETSLSTIMKKQLELLSSEEMKSLHAKELCQRIMDNEDSFHNLMAENYLIPPSERIMNSMEYWESSPDELPQVYDPLRRFFARLFDYVFYNVIWYLILYLTLRIDLQNRSFLLLILDQVLTLNLMLFGEPLLLTQFKTTPGKKILGLQIEKSDGTSLKYHEGFTRTFLVRWRVWGSSFHL